MNYLFPYNLVPQGSNIILYGAGKIGKDFYVQLNIFKNNVNEREYCRIEAWVDKSFDGIDLHSPFDYVKNIKNYEFDYIVIAVGNKKTADEIKNNLINVNIPEKKIIWSSYYRFLGREILPKYNSIMLQNFVFFNDILNEYINDRSGFGLSLFYQSFKKIGIDGQRDTEERIELYDIKNLLKKEDIVLDIGCNCGFLDMQVAPYVKKVIGYEISPSLFNIANKTSKFLNINNVEFHCEDFTSKEHKEKYNVIFAFAIHMWLINENFTENDFVNLMYDLLENNGYLFFESNDFSKFDESFKKLCSLFEDKNMKICLHENISDKHVSSIKREVVIFQKVV